MRRSTPDADAVVLHREDVGESADTVTPTRYLQVRFDVPAG
ncbi:hypothetical protein ACWGI8_29685 [Streptomyces sp. NPDC054841]